MATNSDWDIIKEIFEFGSEPFRIS